VGQPERAVAVSRYQTLGTRKLTYAQQRVLCYIAGSPQAIYMRDVATALGCRYITAATVGALAARALILLTAKGWVITKTGKLRAKEGEQRRQQAAADRDASWFTGEMT
jgi:hypothetical protein